MADEAAKLSKEWSNYLVVEVKDEVKLVDDAIDDTLTRLDEFSGLVDVISCQMDPSTPADILSRKNELLLLFQRVRKLEFAVAQVKQTVDQMDHLVTKAETELNVTTEGKIKNFLRPLFKKKSSPSSASPAEAIAPVFTNPPIFSTKEMFSKQQESQVKP